jgi:hypothetical protein
VWLGQTDLISLRTHGARRLENARLLNFNRYLTLLIKKCEGEVLNSNRLLSRTAPSAGWGLI